MTFFGVAWHADEAECRAYIEEFDVPYDNGLDGDESIFRAYRFTYQPNTVLVTTDGAIFERIVGTVTAENLNARIDALLAAD